MQATPQTSLTCATAGNLTTIEILARYLNSIALSDLPDSTVRIARLCWMDTMVCAYAGRQHPAVRRASEWAKQSLASGSARLWFADMSLSPSAAIFVNSFAASVLDLDDGHRAAAGHPGAAVVPAVLTMASSVGANPLDALVAIACGYEAGLRMARGRNRTTQRSVATGRWAALAVAAAVGKLCGLTAETLAHAMALAESQAPNMLAADHAGFANSDNKEGIPWAALTGVHAVEQASFGLRGYLGALDNIEVYQPDAVASGLGDRWMIDATYFKRFACCRWIHAALDAVLQMREEGLCAQNIQRINIDTFARALSLANATAPQDVIAAQFSYPFCVAVAAVLGIEGLLPLEPKTLKRSDITDLAKRVNLRLDPAMDADFPLSIPCRVEVIKKDGKSVVLTVPIPAGDASNPFADVVFDHKWATLISRTSESDRKIEMTQLARALLENDQIPARLRDGEILAASLSLL